MRTTTGWQSTDGSTALRKVTVERRELRTDDIAVRVDHCGVCHSDLHALHGLGEGTLIPGHEFTGTVVATGPDAGRFAVGDRVAVGNIVDSCGSCPLCARGQENYCEAFPTLTYGGTDRVDGTPTQGAYTREYVLREAFAHRLPDGLDPAAAAPLMCAGVTVWEPLRAAGIGPGSRVAVAGLGGLGHLAVKFAVAFGAEVTVLSRTTAKAGDARALGAAGLLPTTDERRTAEARGRFDLIVDTISVPHDVAPLLELLTLDGTLSLVGHLGEVQVNVLDLCVGRKKLTSAGSGGLPATAEMLEFCAEHGITAEVEVLPSARVGEALERLERGDVRYRFVLDMSDLDG
ncbi:NAD(P)-dependent alcohol dehydrogenase [Streptomyces albidoflavus]|uniref:NAD(P)-dependent alcohol dehydrogenase n=1 Tax=Streptomyces TaxID=1883 RepID=UPI0018A0EBB0|nr:MULTISPECIES: NAD(P)-dependent alcohol dehydrogenase [Streptomyces]MBL0800333.1 NAD(P)-dependent alcohol dehydrogenase [Streptomyces albidoflavus]MBV1958071.1 NAD(P)-dependent alcohol dehydrogenase [Streptomyces sp. BV333]MCK2140243.1 NAD(P)-dependent alcohol dehydrogenase [Streptomyces sp. WAC00276]MCQ9710375.1 NAD(P)-dependent alcohol dehydrogenase [Streptomyces sp. BSP1]MDH6187805.1 putative zinc-type alcohol dehydrogenase-like protein [Streptomyces sp. CZ24]